VARSKVENVWRNVCHPKRPLIPSLTATGRIVFRMIGCPQYGQRLRDFTLAKTFTSDASGNRKSSTEIR